MLFWLTYQQSVTAINNAPLGSQSTLKLAFHPNEWSNQKACYDIQNHYELHYRTLCLSEEPWFERPGKGQRTECEHSWPISQVSAIALFLIVPVAYDQRVFLVQMSVGGWSNSASDSMCVCSMCVSCDFHSNWQVSKRGEWKHMVPHEAWPRVCMLSLPYTSHWPKCHLPKSKVNGMEKYTPLFERKLWQGQRQKNNFRQVKKTTPLL